MKIGLKTLQNERTNDVLKKTNDEVGTCNFEENGNAKARVPSTNFSRE